VKIEGAVMTISKEEAGKPIGCPECGRPMRRNENTGMVACDRCQIAFVVGIAKEIEVD
jgi:ribosomal protein L37AE/L43A